MELERGIVDDLATIKLSADINHEEKVLHQRTITAR
jgi:hypothetical protein